MEAAILSEVKNHHCREPCGKGSNTRISKYACIVEAHESTRKCLERTLPKDHEDRKFIPTPQAKKTLDAKASVEKFEEYQHGK